MFILQESKLKRSRLLKRVLCKNELNSSARSKHYYSVFPFFVFPSVSVKYNDATAVDFLVFNPNFFIIQLMVLLM